MSRREVPSHRFVKDPYLNYGNENTGLDSYIQARRDAENASRQLREAAHSLFRKWEDRNGFVRGAAQILLPAGYTE